MLADKLERKALFLAEHETSMDARERAINEQVQTLEEYEPDLREKLRDVVKRDRERRSIERGVEAELQQLQFWECVHARGVAYRSEPGNLEARVFDRLGPQFGELVACCEMRVVEEGDFSTRSEEDGEAGGGFRAASNTGVGVGASRVGARWVRTPDDLWLPVEVNGVRVLEP